MKYKIEKKHKSSLSKGLKFLHIIIVNVNNNTRVRDIPKCADIAYDIGYPPAGYGEPTHQKIEFILEGKTEKTMQLEYTFHTARSCD